MAARSVSTSRRAPSHARRGAGLVRREPGRVPAVIPERGTGRRTGGVVRARGRQLAARGLVGATGLDSRARPRGRAVLHDRPAHVGFEAFAFHVSMRDTRYLTFRI